MIGLQGQISPVILKVKDLIEQQQRIGKVLSSSIIAFGGTRTRDSLIEGLKYFTKKDVGGNIVTIGFAHSKSHMHSNMSPMPLPMSIHVSLPSLCFAFHRGVSAYGLYAPQSD